jgi:hypothetical protein
MNSGAWRTAAARGGYVNKSRSLVLAGFVVLMVTGLGCAPKPTTELMLRAPVLVTRAGLPAPGELVAYVADKYNTEGDLDPDGQQTADKFTDFLGYADYLFGYNLEYDEDAKVFTGYARVIASIDHDGTKYADTVTMHDNVQTGVSELLLDTLRIALPAK